MNRKKITPTRTKPCYCQNVRINRKNSKESSKTLENWIWRIEWKSGKGHFVRKDGTNIWGEKEGSWDETTLPFFFKKKKPTTWCSRWVLRKVTCSKQTKMKHGEWEDESKTCLSCGMSVMGSLKSSGHFVMMYKSCTWRHERANGCTFMKTEWSAKGDASERKTAWSKHASRGSRSQLWCKSDSFAGLTNHVSTRPDRLRKELLWIPLAPQAKKLNWDNTHAKRKRSALTVMMFSSGST